MKRIIALILSALCAFALFGCAVTEESGSDHTLKSLGEADEVIVHLYGDEEKSLEVQVTKELEELLSGKWEKAAGRDGGDKVITITVGTQHEITFFDNGRAMIYYGYASVVEKDRRYYNVTLDSDIDNLYDYCVENGTVPETEE